MASTAAGIEGEEDQMARKKQLTEKGREAGRSLMKREKRTGPRMDSLQNILTDLIGATIVILIDHASTPIRKQRLSLTSEARREAS